jgi:phosphatidylethanolamine/phosphatidyl-N-methylethanolamine N-methyltransferase
MFRDQRVFLQQFFRQYHTTGSVLPSSRALARALCRFVDADPNTPAQTNGTPHSQTAEQRSANVPHEILEVGPGTGAVTACLVTRLRPEDRLTLVELNDDFVRHLHRRFETEPSFQAVADRTQIKHCRLEDLPADQHFRLIISGLPLNNFAVPEVEQILGIFQRLLGSGGILSFFEYIAIRGAKALVSGPQGRARLRGIGQVLDRTLHGREIKRDWVWPNVPPAWVHHVRF